MSSPRIAKLTWPSEVFYRRLMSVVDDYGRYHAHPMLLRAACYPMQLDKVSEADIGKWLGECQKAALVSVYEISGSAYLELQDFRQQRRAKKSKFPDPPADATHMSSTCISDATHLPANAHLGVCEGEGEGVAAKQSRRTPKTSLPANFAISERVRAWAERRGVFNLDQHFEYFVNRCRAKGYTYADWDEGFMGAVTKDWAQIGTGAPDEKRMVM